MDYYLDRVTFTLSNVKGSTISKLKGTTKGDYPIKLKHPPLGSPEGYPSYQIITVNGITDIIEHRRQEPVFYIPDDPSVWSELGIRQ